jgi:hypothetical protein
MFRRRFHCYLFGAVLLGGAILAPPAAAGPPAYLLLRRAEAPGPHHLPGQPDAALYEARTSGYAYGWFGASPRTHASRHFGYYRTFTQWSWW